MSIIIAYSILTTKSIQHEMLRKTDGVVLVFENSLHSAVIFHIATIKIVFPLLLLYMYNIISYCYIDPILWKNKFKFNNM